MSNPLVSIITPTYNSEEYLERTIESVLDLPELGEYIIVDGGSTDATLNIISKYPEIKLMHQKSNGGMYEAIHMGFEQAQYDLISWINSDDIMKPDGYSKMIDTIDFNQPEIVYSSCKFIDADDKYIRKVKAKRYAKYLLKNGIMPFVQPSSIYTKIAYNKVGGLNFYDYKISADLDLFNKMANDDTILFKRVDCISTLFRKHGSSLGDKNTEVSHKERKQMNLLSPSYISRIINLI